MKDKKDNTDLEMEFLEFVNSGPISPPAYLTEKVKDAVCQDLKPAIWKIFSKLAVIQTVCATLTLIFCPQFEVGFVKHDHLAALVQHSEGFGFMIVCGFIFLGGGAVIAPFLINQTEMKAIEKSVFIYFPTVALLAVLFFYSFGAGIDWSLAFPWFLGGTLGSLTGFELVKYFRFGANKHRG
ncbi:MAG: hypothetical protein KJ804_10325 [Proteobacteria bacterium]|nr:hypothetical protein [Pseudomonadota bacterium]MBU1058698.1 hypothetical protein [Pseudomonadota bacterium]